MRCLFNCCINVCKYLSDKVLVLLNLLIIIPLAICIFAKSYNTYGLRNVGWGSLIVPIALMVAFDILYCVFCKYIYCKERDDNNLGYSSQV
jgi:hypothetical protein